jgi:hypothetical protein
MVGRGWSSLPNTVRIKEHCKTSGDDYEQYRQDAKHIAAELAAAKLVGIVAAELQLRLQPMPVRRRLGRADAMLAGHRAIPAIFDVHALADGTVPDAGRD